MREVKGMAQNQTQNQSRQSQSNEIVGVIIEKEKKFSKLPLVFIDGYSSVKISLVKDFILCPEYRLEHEGCYVYEAGKLKRVSGIYYTPSYSHSFPPYPFLSIEEKKFAKNNVEVEEAISKQLEFINRFIKPSRKWKILIDYNRYHFLRIYEAIEGQKIKFPLKAQHGNLYILEVPPVPLSAPLEYKLYRGTRLYDYEIEFSKEVAIYHVEFIYNGWATLVHNINKEAIEAKLNSPDQSTTIMLESGKHYLFTHPEII